MKLSIVIPIYNAEKYLDRCLKSVMNDCPNSGVEIILVNDGSKDASGNIAEQWENSDPRIRLINQSNQGVSVARNTGIVNATGEYITFVDADDLLAPDYFAHVLPKLNCGIDLILYSHYYENEQHHFIEKQLPLSEGIRYTNTDLLRLPLTWTSNAVWDKVFKRSIIVDHMVQFPQGMKTSEDLIFFISLVKFVNNYEYIPKPLYYYCYVLSGAVRQFRPEYFHDLEIVYQIATQYIYDVLDQSYFADFSKILLWQYVDLISNCDFKYYKEIYTYIYKNKDSCIYILINSDACSTLHWIYQQLFRFHSLVSIRALYKLIYQVKRYLR